MINFQDAERLCQSRFLQLGQCWHLWTPEDYAVIFPDVPSFMKGMNVMGITSALFPDVAILTFELMSNHLHLTAAGDYLRVCALFGQAKSFLSRALGVGLSGWECSLRELESLIDTRNVITYNNRNGFLVDAEESPFSYRWGANSFYFNREAKARYLESGSTFSFNERRTAAGGHKADGITSLKRVDGYVSPLSYCSIEKGESLFRNASHYFYEVSRNIESQRTIAAEIGERIFYNDNELFSIVLKKARERHGVTKPSLLPVEAKLELARELHFDYNASNKQVQRMLSMDIRNVEALFPPRP